MSDAKVERKPKITIDALHLLYVKIAQPETRFGDAKWKASAAISKKEMKRIKKEYPDLRKRFDALDPEEYLERFKVESPLADKDEDVYILNLDQKAEITWKDKATGETKKRAMDQPKVLLKTDDMEKPRNITLESLVGNGSVGKVLAYHRRAKADKDGNVADVLSLGGVLVTHLIEYEGGDSDGGGFEHDVGADFGFTDIEEGETKIKPRAVEAEADDEPPFDTDDDADYD